ncbi:MAG TPA: L,D-transpeptidase family protein [Stellaceae bacterium]|nr:L,D-transpeptidase family protein [Stellaceae bacterium]
MHLRLSLAFAALGLAAVVLGGPARGEESPVAAEIHALVTAPGGDSAPTPLQLFYEMRAFAPVWVDHPQRLAALDAVLADAPSNGIAFRLPKRLLPSGGADDAARDVALTRLALDYATALAVGRVRPDQVEADWAMPEASFDAAAGLDAALKGDLARWYAGLAPNHPAYRRLVAALAQYRAIAAAGGWVQVPRGAALKLGMIDPRVRTLRLRLAAEGDLPAALAPAEGAALVAGGTNPVHQIAATEPAPAADPAAPADPASIYDSAVEQAVRHFQARHGIDVDGAVGPRTLAAMNVTVRARIAQIELNLERWRAMPHDLGSSFMLVNVPAEQLTVVEHDVPVIGMKVVVGDPAHPTPVVRAFMVAVTLNPTWTIPASIVKNELVPKTKRDPGYLKKNDIVFTPGRGWQQMPGPKNPLGRIKFESPNRFDVYLHDTPSRIAFDRYFRAQSHGCVRLERADELAGFVLRDTSWDQPALQQAIATGQNRRIDLKHRWRIYLVYATSFVDDDGTVEFRDDLYGRDARLRAALAAQGGEHEPQKQARLGGS